MRIFTILCLGILLVGCKKKDSPKPPGNVALVSPAKNSECTPIQSSGNTNNVVLFSWQAAEYSETYELRVTNLNSGSVQTKTTKLLSETLPLEKGAPFSWQVISRNSSVPADKGTSDTWFFYNPGVQTSYAPFPAEVLEPLFGARIFMDINNEVILKWTGSDLDNDIFGYEIYLSVENPPLTLIGTPPVTITDLKISVASNTVYYWKVVTKDAEGNTSDSGIFSFKVL